MPTQPKSLRLSLKADTAPPSRFSGGWWPRSLELEAELPVLIRALSTRLGVIRRVGYNINAWGLLARHLTVDGCTLRLEGFSGQDRYSLRITGMVPGVLCLLVVPPEATEAAAHAALAAACTQSGFSRDILAACHAMPTGDLLSAPARQPRIDSRRSPTA